MSGNQQTIQPANQRNEEQRYKNFQQSNNLYFFKKRHATGYASAQLQSLFVAFLHMGFIHTFSVHYKVLIEKEWSCGNGCVWSKLAIKSNGLGELVLTLKRVMQMISSVHNEHYICKQCLNVFIMPIQYMACQPVIFKCFKHF